MRRQLAEVDGVLMLVDYEREVRVEGDVTHVTETVHLLAQARTVMVHRKVSTDGPDFFDLDGPTAPDAPRERPAPRGTT